MGIDGLLQLLKPITQKQHISSFHDKVVAVDAMPWIYKGCYTCAMQLNQDIQSIDFLYYILQMIDMLSYYNIKPIFVFDGRALIAKGQTLDKRRKDKQQNKQKGLQFLKNNQLDQARKYLSRCIIIDQRIITMTINTLVTKGIQFYVAPYQADCQIAKLKRLGIIDAAITQDSDLIIFGVNVILKLNQNGDCDYIDLNAWRPKDTTDNFLKYFLAFDQLNRIDAAILAGSDYNKSVKGIGIRRAIKLLTTQVTMANVINKLKFKKTYMGRIPQNYLQTVQKSKLIFLFSTVYDPNQKRLDFLRPQLLETSKPENMTIDQLKELVGIHYEYTEEVCKGFVSSKTLQKRDIKVLNFPRIFRANKQNMMIHQAMLRSRKLQAQKLKKQRLEEQAKQSIDPDLMIFEQLNQFKSRVETNFMETQEDKQKRKQERKNRISKLQDLMNTIVDIFGSSDQQDQLNNSQENSNQGLNENRMTQQKEKRPFLFQQSGKKNNLNIFISNQKKSIAHNSTQIKNSQKNNEDSDHSYLSQQESCSQDLGNLNPFAKKDTKLTPIKSQHLNGTKKK